MIGEPNIAADLERVEFDGPVPYCIAYDAQIRRRNAVEDGRATEALFLLEHTPVLTLGRNAREAHLLESREALAHRGIEVAEADRGGDVTYHGPGQLVAYPILDLTKRRRSIPWYLRTLEQVIIDVLGEYGVQGERAESFTGVWVGGAKVAAIGVGIHNWVTYHGLALNVDPNMEHFGLIVPCGIPHKPVTSMKTLLGTALEMPDVMDRLARQVARHLGRGSP